MAPKRPASDETSYLLRKYVKIDDVVDEDSSEKETPFTWSFYESEDTYLIDESIRARLAWNDFLEVFQLHFARKTKKGKVNHMSITAYEAHSFVEFLEEILAQMEKVPDLGKPGQKLIPFFDNKPDKRAYEYEGSNWEAFWKSPDLLLPSVRVRICMNRRTGMYILFVNSPVPSKLSAEYHGWQGPQLVFKSHGMKVLLDFLKQSIEKSLFEPIE